MGFIYGRIPPIRGDEGDVNLSGKGNKLRRPRSARTPRWAEVWQIPLLCIGLALCLLALNSLLAQTSNRQTLLAHYEHEIDALDHRDTPRSQLLLKEIETKTQEGKLDLADRDYLLSASLLCEASQRFPLPCATAEAKDAYTRAQTALEQVTKRHVNFQHPRLAYRLALAGVGVSFNTTTLDNLEQSLEVNFVDRELGYQQLSKWRVLTSPPDLAGALRCLDLSLSMTPPEKQYGLRVQKMEILARLARWADIPRIASTIPVDAPENFSALQWQALAAFEQKQWGEAARLWATVPTRQLTPQALLYYGQCQQQLKNTADATRYWERVWREHLNTPEAIKAQALLSDLAFEQSRWNDAATSITSILTSQSPTQLPNAYLSMDDLGSRVKTLADKLIQLRRWEELQRIGQACMQWPFAGLGEYWLSLSWHAQAEALAGVSSSQEKMRVAYLRASTHALNAVEQAPEQEKAMLLLSAGKDALLGKAYQQAQKALGKLLTMNPEAAIKPQVLLGLAESLQAQQKNMLAIDRLREALQIPGPHEATVRLRLAQLLLLDDKHSQEAGVQLELAAAQASRKESGPDAQTACHRWAAYLYNGVVENKSNQTLQAISACEKALQHAFPHPEAAQTRYLLAELLLAEARPQSRIIQANTDDQLLRKQAQQLWQACQHFQLAHEELQQPQSVLFSSQKKDTLIRYALFGQAECWFGLAQLRSFAPSAVPASDVCWQR